MRLLQRGRTGAVLAAMAWLFPLAGVGWAEDPPARYVDFNAPQGGAGTTEANAFNSLADAVTMTGDGFTLKIIPGASSETITISGQRRLERHGDFSTVQIGAAGILLTVAVNGGGGVTPGTGHYAPGPLTLLASPDTGAGWIFLRWEADISGAQNPRNINLAQETTAFARFSPPAPDFLLGSAALTQSGPFRRGDTIEVAWGVENYGQVDADGTSTAWEDGVYLSTDPEWDPADKLLGTKSIAQLVASGASYNTDTEVTLPDVAPGRYWLIVRVDVDGAVGEAIVTVEENTMVAGEILVLDPELSNE